MLCCFTAGDVSCVSADIFPPQTEPLPRENLVLITHVKNLLPKSPIVEIKSKQQLLTSQFVDFVNKQGGKIDGSQCSQFTHPEWKRGKGVAKEFCEKSNGELIYVSKTGFLPIVVTKLFLSAGNKAIPRIPSGATQAIKVVEKVETRKETVAIVKVCIHCELIVLDFVSLGDFL